MSSPTLTDKVSKMIRQDILNGDLKPGQKLVVAELKEKYAVGASPIREALVQLSWKKYVRLEPQKGCWVSSVTHSELSDLFESLKIAASHLLKKAIQQGDENWELEVLSAFHKLSRIQHTEDAFDNSEWEERHQRFHTALLEGSDAHTMYGFFLELDNQVKRYRYLALNSDSFDTKTFINVDEHESLMKLVLAKNEDQALQVLEKHLDNTQRKIESILPEEEE
ncbi:putative Transcriptional regulator LuxZ [Vibrio nigripulchritudo MADA3029]|nr:GntR family transcriptional regulator [Vibrio nigripulchritudo]CCN45150.1 putative Transcriptional regulator LuxZ [Vibrio nigripulchritudo MADA3020]CCN54488.1 putative Transcriptional regulator LuxZ [Vibrio nigripulchritudo MADA3021]CCN57538.1 putative Transcriptional regulator LuxZ [Vibrio nigripulchritudo MADA3029]CCN73922.1 putative Transcriptional regulator LuxZ [Vibrio nigripulchritudo SFn118]